MTDLTKAGLDKFLALKTAVETPIEQLGRELWAYRTDRRKKKLEDSYEFDTWCLVDICGEWNVSVQYVYRYYDGDTDTKYFTFPVTYLSDPNWRDAEQAKLDAEAERQRQMQAEREAQLARDRAAHEKREFARLKRKFGK